MDQKDTKLITLNCNGFKSNSTFIDKIIHQNDCIFLNELWLTHAEKHLLHDYKRDFHVFYTPAKQGSSSRPYGGTALLLRKTIHSKSELILQEDYTTIVKTMHSSTDNPILFIGVYLQCISNTCDYKNIYETQLNTIKGIIHHFIDDSSIIMFGDFQSFPKTEGCTRNANRNALSGSLESFITEGALIPIDIKMGTGPCYTYHHTTMLNQSYIDHIVVSADIVDRFFNTKVSDPDYLNISDHLPVSTAFTLYNITSQSGDNRQEEEYIPNYMWKNKTFQNNFQSTFNQMTFDHHMDMDLATSITQLQESLKQAALKAYNELKEDSHFHFINNKRWWNQDLKNCRTTLQQMFNHWRATGFNREPDNLQYNRYLFARKNFRSLVKRYKSQSVVDHYVNVEKIKKIRPKSYWNQIRSAKSSHQKLYTINNKTNVNDITSEFKGHFDNLLNTPRTDQINNKESNDQLETMLDELKELRDIDFTVNEEDLLKAIRTLHKEKAYDPFGIKAEHFIYAFESCSQNFHYLKQIINNVFTSNQFPELLSTSHIVPVIKSHKKPISDANNYRGISLIPIITKIIEIVILQKCPQLKNHANQQYGFASDGSTLHAEFLINETIRKYNSKNSPIYICSLDAEKAFDSCNWMVLFSKIKETKTLPLFVLRFLIQLYLHGDAKVKYNNHISSPFSLSQGVRQGSILSPYLYNLYTEDILREIDKMNIGASLDPNINTSIIAYS